MSLVQIKSIRQTLRSGSSSSAGTGSAERPVQLGLFRMTETDLAGPVSVELLADEARYDTIAELLEPLLLDNRPEARQAIVGATQNADICVYIRAIHGDGAQDIFLSATMPDMLLAEIEYHFQNLRDDRGKSHASPARKRENGC